MSMNILLDQNLYYDLIILLLHYPENNTVKQLVNEFIKLYDEYEHNLVSSEKEIIAFYVYILKDILTTKRSIKDQNDLIVLLNKYKTSKVVEKHKDIYGNLNKIISNNISEDFLNNIKRRLTNILLYHKCRDNVKRIYSQLAKFQKAIDDDERSGLLSLVGSEINNLNVVFSDTTTIFDPSRTQGIETINVKNRENIEQAVKSYIETDISNPIKLGLQGLNMMNHPIDGFSMGSSVIFSALSHHFKTSMLLNVTRWILEYNDFSTMYNNPLILFVTLENKADKNLMWLFKRFYYNQNKDDPDVFVKMSKMTDQEIIDYLYNYLSSKDTTLVIERFRPDQFGFEELVQLVTRYENSGFKVVCLIIDYLSLMKKKTTNTSSGMSTPLAIQELYNQVCNFTKDLNITLFSAHQLNREAARLATLMDDPVRKFNETHLAYSTDVHREVDVMIMMHVVRTEEGRSFLTMKLFKNRYRDEVKEQNKYVAYELLRGIGLVDDVNTKFAGYRSLKSISNNNPIDFLQT